MKHLQIYFLAGLLALLCPLLASAQVNSGSNGSDGAFNPTQNVTIDMADHPTGIYQYTSVNITAGVTVNFKPNTNNTPVVWLVQGDCVIGGTVDVSGQNATGLIGGRGGPGGYAGGSGGTNPTSGQGPGGGAAGNPPTEDESAGSFGTTGGAGTPPSPPAGAIYGNSFLLPLLGGSGGGGTSSYAAGGGGGAILIVASNSISVGKSITTLGGNATFNPGYGPYGSGGSGGGVRLVTTQFSGSGTINTAGGLGYNSSSISFNGGSGRIRIDAFEDTFGGNLNGVSSQGFQPIILPASGQGVQLNISSVAGTAVPASPSGVLANPDVIIPAQQTNPIPVVVHCSNVPLNTEITVVVHPASGSDVQVVGLNNTGTTASSTATVSLNMPRGGGILYAKAVTGIVGTSSTDSGKKERSIAETGWTASGERFKAMEIIAQLGGKQRITYISESGKRYPLN